MPGSPADPVILDQYQTIIEVGWPSAVAFEVRAYFLWTVFNQDPNTGQALPIKCSPIVGIAGPGDILPSSYTASVWFTYKRPGDNSQNASKPIKSAWKWKPLTQQDRDNLSNNSLHYQRTGKWESLSTGKVKVLRGFPPDPFNKTNVPAWTRFGQMLRWEDLDGNQHKYYVPEQDFAKPDIFFKMEQYSADIFWMSVPISGAPICRGQAEQTDGVIAVAPMVNPGNPNNYTAKFLFDFAFDKAEIEVETDRKSEVTRGHVRFHMFEVAGIQITPRPWVMPNNIYFNAPTNMPPGYSVDVGPATIWLLCKRSGGREGPPGS